MTGRALALLLALGSPAAAERREYLSDPYRIDRIYKSMEGPQSTRYFALNKERKGEIYWLTGLKTEMVDEAGKAPMRPEFMCHVNLDLDPARPHADTAALRRGRDQRLFTLSQGQTEVRFPKGFGLPLASDEALMLTTQVLNHNEPKIDITVRHKVTVELVRDADLRAPLKPLRKVGVFGLARVAGPRGHYGFPQAETETHGPTCMEGQHAGGGGVLNVPYRDRFDREFSGHWVVKPGREVNHTNVTRLMQLDRDTTLHYVAVHLHPFAESLELRDRTTGKTVFKSRVGWTPEGRVGLARVDHFSSEKGLPLFRDHEYELISVYNNTSGVDQDSMAVMHLFVLDRKIDAGAAKL
jgi:hypothetical protein